jgi:hypothetical protein
MRHFCARKCQHWSKTGSRAGGWQQALSQERNTAGQHHAGVIDCRNSAPLLSLGSLGCPGIKGSRHWVWKRLRLAGAATSGGWLCAPSIGFTCANTFNSMPCYFHFADETIWAWRLGNLSRLNFLTSAGSEIGIQIAILTLCKVTGLRLRPGCSLRPKSKHRSSMNRMTACCWGQI